MEKEIDEFENEIFKTINNYNRNVKCNKKCYTSVIKIGRFYCANQEKMF